MPIYDYGCSACGHVVEVIHGINDLGPRFCPACGADGTMRKGFTTPAVHFKGSGWAKKDRRATSAPGSSSTKPKAESADAPSETSSSTSSDGSAEKITTVKPAPAAAD